jgi:TP901 family phage tail tape measure protein
MADGKVVIETDLDSSGIEKGLSNLETITVKGLKAAAAAITGTATALAGVATAAAKTGADFESQMSRVKAISGATGEEFEKLKAQAIELGAETSFSALQAAEGMENLAAAGFTTTETMEAMPGLLDLAAASGEDLASSSDIAASVLRGFGMEASEAGHVADVLAENANRTNSSVAETGEAMKYVAPLARAAGLSFEETAAAIGVMANAGIQGSQAGTTLRGAISRLSKPTDDMQNAMDDLGVSFYDANGKMKSLSEQVGLLKDAMSGMTDEQKNSYLVTLYGQEALSGMLALINEGSDSLSALTEAYEVCDGSAKKAAETMQDNLSGAVEQLKGSAESLGIVFYEKVSEGLKEAAQSATESVNNITDALTNGGIKNAVNVAGNEFADLAVSAASHAPEMIDAAVSFIESFASGIVNNKGKLLGAAGDVADALANGLAELLPNSLRKPAEDAIDALSESLESGGLKKAGKTVVNTLGNVIDVVGKLADAALPPLTKTLDFAGDHLDLLAASAATAFVAFKGYKVLTSVNKAAKTLTATAKMLSAAEKANALQVLAASGALTVKEMVVGVCTGKIKLATAAQAAWNAVMNANPIGLLVTAIGALVAGIGAYAFTQKSAASATGELTEKQKESIEASKEAIKNIEEEAAARQKTINASTVEIDQAESLWNELTKITDENGRVKDGYEARANYITGELSSALGVEIDLTDGVINNYQQLTGSIYDLIAAKKAQAVMDSMESEYAQAIQDQAENVAKLAQSYNGVIRLQEEKIALETEAAELAKSTNYADASRYAEIKDELQGVNNELKVQKVAFEENQAAVKDNQKVIADYDKLTEAVMSGSTEKINSALADIQSGLDTTLDSGSKAALEQAQTTGDSLLSILTAQEQGLAEVQQSTIDRTADAMGVALNTIGSSSENMKSLLESVGEDGAQKLLTAMKNADLAGNLSEEAKSGMQAMIAAIESEDGTLKSTGKDSASKYAEGMESQSERVKTAGRTISDSADSGARSKTGYDAGYGFGSGFVSGIHAWVGQGIAAAANLAAEALASAKATIDSHSPSKETLKLGKYFGQGFELGIAGEEKSVAKVSENLANTALKSLDMSAISSRMRESVAINTNRVARSFATESRSTILSKQQTEMLMRMSDVDKERLALKIGRVTADEISKNQNNRPIYLGTDRIDRPLPKGAIPRI